MRAVAVSWVSLIIREKCLSVKDYCDIVRPSMTAAFSFNPVSSPVATYAYAWRYWVRSEEASAVA
jgi:hypothetical protein